MQRGFGLFGVIVVAALSVALLATTGLISFNAPWDNIDFTETETVVQASQPAQLVEIEPIALDCRSRVHAEVPVEGNRRHKVFGATYRTDTVTMLAIGDVDTCVDADQVQVVTLNDGVQKVFIPGESIEFVRPRVDAHATRDSVRFNKGWVGGLTDAFPWVSDNEGLTPAAYAYAQSVIGGSDCMRAAYQVTRQDLLDAYARQAVKQGIDPNKIEVQITGSPRFGQNDDALTLDENFDFEVADGEALCEVGSSVDSSRGAAANPEPADPTPNAAALVPQINIAPLVPQP